MSNFDEFNRRYTARYNEKLKKTCEPFFQTCGLTSFFYQSRQNNYFVTLCSDVDLQDYYFNNKKYYKSNPFIMDLNKLKTGLYFSDSVENQKFQESEVDLQNRFNIKYAYRFVTKTAVGYQEFGFGRPPIKKETDLLIINQTPLIYKFIDYFKLEMREILRDMEFNAISLGSAPLSGIPDIEFEKSKNILLLKKIGFNLSILEIKLTRREIDCLRLYFKGYSAKNIAGELFLSTRTVENYLNTIKNKFSCCNKSELLKTLHLMREFNIHREIFTP